jgi:hypothetical protein
MADILSADPTLINSADTLAWQEDVLVEGDWFKII